MFCTVIDSKLLVRIEASKLSMNDEFMQHLPRSIEEKKLKDRLELVISSGIKDFYRPIVDPSLSYNGKLVYITGLRPALGKSYNWWVNAAQRISNLNKARLGTKNEYIAFLGVLLKKLVASGWNVNEAWNAVCNDSAKLGNYQNSVDGHLAPKLTGSNEACGFFDLANTYKILAGDNDDDSGFFMASGCYRSVDNQFPIADINTVVDRISPWHIAVGWIVLETD